MLYVLGSYYFELSPMNEKVLNDFFVEYHIKMKSLV